MSRFVGGVHIEMNKTLKKIWNALTSVLVAVVVIFALLLVGARLIGLQVFTVLSGSMEPTYHTGSIIYVKSVDYKQLQVGDVITFMLDEDTIATHRIIEVLVDEADPNVLRYFTKGDANETPDGSSVHYMNIIGTPVFTIPYLGYVATYVQNPPGTYITIAGGAVLLLLVFIPDLFDDSDGKKKKSKKDKKAPAPSEDGETEAPVADDPAPELELSVLDAPAVAEPEPVADPEPAADSEPVVEAEPEIEPAPAPSEEPAPLIDTASADSISDELLFSEDFLKELGLDL